MEARQGCDGEDTQWEGPGVLRGWDPVPEALRVVFNPAPWDSPSPSGLLLAEAGFCPWLGCSPAATSASKGACLHFSECPEKGRGIVIRSSGSWATAVGLLCLVLC